ncbi:50S ribosomal subunit protein L15 [Candidatus Blochmanniella floridana]|uniref:Large ribosomal subunit protein uL15 n=1 Tax=Blochmanniella floridana TaxID=203907 RepID=RL15_BLOFL|nr:RecName: Full=Large ribosomal subunit protein uL15; AltName: Full=50S ribosomal protein L15 [Candidatus Blochmannia floridanus]CAD83725.1 50S ribosomal subunit protein L15 [Candidatus Blochmannia floridanus]
MFSLNTIAPALGAKRVGKRVARGIGSGFGKTAGRGHKGQKSRSGCKIKVSFEGGQTPLHRRLPKFGFKSRKSIVTQEITLFDLSRIPENVIDLNVLKKYDIVSRKIRFVKIIMSGTFDKPVIIRNLRISKGARDLIKSVGGRIEEGE